MRKKYLSALLFGVALTTATGSFVSCSDYDDDIDNLQEQITANADAIKKLQELVGNGQFVTGVTKSGHDLVFTVNNGSSITVASVDGKDGEKGEDGKDGSIITLDPETKNWIIDGKDTGVCAEGKDGLPGTNGTGTPGAAGKDGKSPKIGENGNWFVWDAEKEEWVDTEVSTDAKTYVVAYPLYYELNVVQQAEEGNSFAKIKLPATAVITSIKPVSNLAENSSWFSDEEINAGTWNDENGDTHVWVSKDTPYVRLSYGKNAQGKSIEFNGKTYQKDEVLYAQGNQLGVQINPVLSDASKYDFSLIDSKGNTSFVLGKATPHKSEEALSRADATPNLGMYLIPVSLKSGLKEVPNYSTVYAVSTTDYQGNQLLSEYNVRVDANEQHFGEGTYVWGRYTNVELGKAGDLKNALSGSQYVVDCTFDFPKDQTAKKAELGASINGQEITATKAGTIQVVCKYLRLDGKIIETSPFTVRFIPAATEGDLATFAWTVTNDAKKKTVEVDASALLPYFNYVGTFTYPATYSYANSADKSKYGEDAGEGISENVTFVRDTNDEGYPTLKAQITFDETKVAPTSFEGKLTLYGNGSTLAEKTVNFTVTVNANGSFDFKPLDAYFNADKTEATAYGQPNATGKITYDLYSLFKIDEANKTNISFTETIPATYKDKDKNDVVAQSWLGVSKSGEYTNNSEISVQRADAKGLHKEDGVNSQREITVKYVPFGNRKIEAITKTFKVTVVSEVAKGEFKYINWTAVKDKADVQSVGKTKEINGEVGATLELREIQAADVYGKNLLPYTTNNKSVKSMDSRIEKISVVLADDSAKDYLTIDKSELTITDDINSQIVNISKKGGNTGITTPPTCTVAVKILDKWGVTTTVNVQVKVNK